MLKFLRGHYRKRYHSIYRHAKKLFAFDIALFLFALFMLAGNIFLFFWKPSLTDQVDVSISLGNERIKSGEEIRLTVNYANKSKYKLNAVSLGLRLPDGFIVNREKSPKTVFGDDSIFTSLSEIKAGASGQVEIYGWFWTETNRETKFIVNLSYTPEHNKNREQKLSSFIANISDSVLVGRLDMSVSAFPNISLPFTYTLKNSSDRKINDVSIVNNWNADIIDEKNATNITLAPDESKIIEGRIVTPDKGNDFSLIITPRILVSNRVISQSPAVQKIHVYAPQIISSAELSQKIDYAEAGQIIPIKIKWENKSSFKLQDITLRLTSNLTDVVDWKKTARDNGAKHEQNGLFFDNSSRTNLSDGNPQSSDAFSIKIYLLPAFNLPETEKAVLEIYPVVETEIDEVAGQKFVQEGSRAAMPLATELGLSGVEVRYYTNEGDQLGRGPLPPRVDKTTKYWIFVKINNTTNAVTNPTFTVALPEGVEFSGKQSVTIGPQLKHDNGVISWKHDYLPANSRTGLYFEIAVTPQSWQTGQDLALVNSLTFSATDEFTLKKFNLSHPALTNILMPDDIGRKFGSKVQ